MEGKFKVRSAGRLFELVFNDPDGSTGEVDGKPFSLDVVETKTGFHVLRDGTGYNIDLLGFDPLTRKVELRINHQRYSFLVEDRYDELLHQLGMDKDSGSKVAVIKAPMPGLVLDVMIGPGDSVLVDQPLIILEAMKMENIIKSPSEGMIKGIGISKGDSVEKNQVLIEFV